MIIQEKLKYHLLNKIDSVAPIFWIARACWAMTSSVSNLRGEQKLIGKR